LENASSTAETAETAEKTGLPQKGKSIGRQPSDERVVPQPRKSPHNLK
jgi:hypothetical protein